MNKTLKLALLAGAASSVALGGYVAVKRHKANQATSEIPTEVVEEQPTTVIEKEPEPTEDAIPMTEVLKITDDDEDDQAAKG